MSADILGDITAATQQVLRERFGHEVDAKRIQIDKTRKEFQGDYTLVVFPFVKALGMSVEDVGKSIGEALVESVEAVDDFNVIKGFLNIQLGAAYWFAQLADAINEPTSYASAPDKGLIMVEYSSPNTNKPLHLGHLRNNFLGHSVSLIREFNGYEVIKTQIVNDRGVHICKSVLAWQKFGNGETPESTGMKGDKLVGKYYVLFDEHLRAEVKKLAGQGMDEEIAKKEASLTREVQEMLVKWENGDPETLALWKKMNGWVYEGFEQTYRRMGVEFDKMYYESETYLKGKEIVQLGLDKKIFSQKEDGSIWADLEEDGLDSKLLVRADGTTVYMTQDIGTAAQRYEDYPSLKQIIYTVGDEQDYHFKVLFLILEKMGFEWAPACRHLSYGMVDLPTGKMKSREGTVVDADELMDEVVDAARASSVEKGKLDEMSKTEQQDLFEMLGIGALKFYLLKVDPKKRMMFNPEESVSLQGDTGPFVQYTHARCKAVLRKSGEEAIRAFKFDGIGDIDEKERLLLRELLDLENVVQQASDQMNPSLIAGFCLEIARLYNQFYHELPILKAGTPEREFRLGLTFLTAETIRTAMALLGIRVPDRM